VVECPAERLAPGRVVQRAAARLTVPAGRAGEAFAARHGIATPLNAAVCALLDASVDSASGGKR
jgi:hypothetical protein